MKVLIIEDERIAADRLAQLILEYESHINILDKLDSIETAVAWLKNNPEPDLIFLDIQLADGLSFNIFDQVRVTCPIIFCTAYDEYALRAFRLNSIDYLLKPVDYEGVAQALDKYVAFFAKETQASDLPEAIEDMISYSQSRLKIVLKESNDPDILVSK